MERKRCLHDVEERQRVLGDTASRLGADIQGYLGKNRSLLNRNASIVDIWGGILPAEFYKHSHLAGISGGVLRVEVEPGPYMHELRIMKDELLEHLQNQRTGIKDIRLCAGNTEGV